jgi:hypothetical protein
MPELTCDAPGFEYLSQLDEDDKAALRREIMHKWDQPRRLYLLVVLCSMAAAVQGVCGLKSIRASRSHIEFLNRWTKQLLTEQISSLHRNSGLIPRLAVETQVKSSGSLESSTLRHMYV